MKSARLKVLLIAFLLLFAVPMPSSSQTNKPPVRSTVGMPEVVPMVPVAANVKPNTRSRQSARKHSCRHHTRRHHPRRTNRKPVISHSASEFLLARNVAFAMPSYLLS